MTTLAVSIIANVCCFVAGWSLAAWIAHGEMRRQAEQAQWWRNRWVDLVTRLDKQESEIE